MGPAFKFAAFGAAAVGACALIGDAGTTLESARNAGGAGLEFLGQVVSPG